MIEEILNTANYTFNPYALPVLIVSCLFLILAFKSLTRENRSIGLSFFLLSLVIALWLASYFFLYCTTSAKVALWWIKMAYVAIPFIPAALYHFSVSIVQARQQYQKSLCAGWILSAVFAYVIVTTDLVISGVRHFWWGYYAQYTLLSIIYLAFAGWFQLLALLRMFQAYQQTKPGSTGHLRTRSLLVAGAISSLGFIDYLPKFGISIYPFGYLPLLVTIVLVDRVIQRYRLVDITPRFASQAIIETMNDSLLVLDIDGVIRLVNAATTLLLGHAERDLVGKTLSTIFDNTLFFDHIVALGNNGTIKNLEISYAHPNGSTYFLDLSASIMRDENERPLAYVFIARDITHIKRTEAELISARDELEARVEERSRALTQANEHLMREKTFSDTIIDSLPGIFYICSEEGRLVRWNNNEKEVTGYTERELLQLNVLTLFQNDRASVANAMREVLESGQAVVEASLVTKSGMSVPFYLTGFRMVDQDKRFIVGVGINLSERNRLVQQLHQSQKMEAVGVLAGGVAHDFNNILSAIIGYATLINMKMAPDDPLRHNVEQILHSADRAAGVTGSLLAFSRKQALHLQTLNVNTVISSFHKLMARLINEDIRINLALSGKNLPVKADKGQLEQVLMNLLTNARDAMATGGTLTITSEAVTLHEDRAEHLKGTYAVISVSDTGKGMDRETQEHIFEPFYTTKEVGKGTGLGLAIVYGIIKKHDGSIAVQSEPGAGTTFRIYLPLQQDEQPAVTENSSDDQMQLLRGTESVLLVEDDLSVRQMTKALLETFGYRVWEAVDGNDGITVFREHHGAIDLVICDLIMPNKNGKETHEALIKIKPEIKTIFVSGYTADILAQKGQHDEPLHFVAKPFDPITLLTKIRSVLNRA